MDQASISYAKNRLSALVDRVRAGETVLLTDRGRTVAMLAPPPAADGDGRAARLERGGLLLAPSRPSDTGWLDALPWPDAAEPVTAALLQDRQDGDR
jgi:antitoxin (DNA-binding transcriptional repressor) of toxin-antitoxin stability system